MIERRSATLDRVSFRAPSSSGDPLQLSGYAALTGVPYEVGFFVETLAPGCFKRSLASNPDTVLNLQHGTGGSGLPMARTKGGTLSLFEDATGLGFVADLDWQDPDTQLMARKFARGDLTGAMSFAFQADSDTWNDAFDERQIQVCSLHRGDVSVVVHAANEQTYSALSTDPQPRSRPVPAPDWTRLARAQVRQLRDREILRERRSRR